MTRDDPRLHLYLNGPPQLRRGSRSLALERKAAGALAWLALRGPVLRVRLAELLWPAASPDGARNNLRQLIFKLKKAMEVAVIEGQDELRLPQSIAVDDGAGGGTLLDGCEFDDCPAFAAWLEIARTERRQRTARQRLQGVDDAFAAGDLDRALSLAQAAVADDELSEPAHLRLVQALYLHGERQAALDAAARCETVLRDALDMPPSAELVRLISAIRSAEPPASAASPMPVTVLKPPRLIGRRRETALLRQAAAEQRVALVVGEPGLGKSRLLAEAAPDGVVLLGTRPGDAAVPFAALSRWLRQLHARMGDVLGAWPPALHFLLPDLAPAGVSVGPMDRQLALAGVFDRARAAGLTGAWLDDLHFADDASIEALQALMDEPALAPLHWALARRAAEGAPALRALADGLLDGGRLLGVTLQPLDAAQVAELVESLGVPGLDGLALAPGLVRSTGGNPMFVLETVKAMLLQPRGSAGVDDLPRPRSVGVLIERRLRQLSPPALALARVAALAGPDFSTDLAMHVLQTPLMAMADAWSELESAQVLRDSAFAHDLIFEATLASVPAAIRRHARRAIAEFLAPRDGEPARVAEHWLAAGEPAHAAPHFVAAGHRAEAAARYAEARELFERAAACHDRAHQYAQGFDTRLALADLLMEAAQSEAAFAVLDALEDPDRTVDERVRLTMQRMQATSRTARYAESVRIGAQLLADDDVTADVTPERLAMLRWTLAQNLTHVGRAPDALAQLQLAQPVLATHADAQWRGWFHSQHAVALYQVGEVTQALAAQQQAVEAARDVGRRRMIAGCLQNGANFAAGAGRLVVALDQLDECLLLMADAGSDAHLTQYARAQRGRVLGWLGRYREAIDVLEPMTADEHALQPDQRALSAAALVAIWVELGQPARAAQSLAIAQGCGVAALVQAQVAQCRGHVAWLSGGPCDEVFAEAYSLAPDGIVRDRIELLRGLARPDSVTPADLAGRRARWESRGMAGHVVVADVLAARLARQRGDAAAAATWVARALPALRQVMLAGAYRPCLALEMARCAAADSGLAQRALQDGVDWIHSVTRFHVPEPFRDSFLQRNRINRELLALADSQRR